MSRRSDARWKAAARRYWNDEGKGMNIKAYAVVVQQHGNGWWMCTVPAFQQNEHWNLTKWGDSKQLEVLPPHTAHAIAVLALARVGEEHSYEVDGMGAAYGHHEMFTKRGNENVGENLYEHTYLLKAEWAPDAAAPKEE